MEITDLFFWYALIFALPALMLFVSSFLYKLYRSKSLKVISIILLIIVVKYYLIILFYYGMLFREGFLSLVFIIFQIFALATVSISAFMIFRKK